MNYYEEIKEKLLKGEIYDRVKDYSKDRNKVNVYFEIGKLLSEAGKEYGKSIIKQYSLKLVIEVGKKYNERTLYSMRKFYEVFSNEKLNTLWSKLSWSHYRELITLKNVDEIKYYIIICEHHNFSQRQLRDRIKNHEYDRLSDETKDKIIKSEHLKVDDLVPNPILIMGNSINEKLTEYALKQAVLNNLDEFLLQLGNGFTYVGNEFKIKFKNTYNYIDLLLYNIKFKCYVVVELKIGELKKEYVVQIEIYMNYIDKNIKTINENKTIGIIIVKKNNQYIMEYCSDKRIISKEYELV